MLPHVTLGIDDIADPETELARLTEAAESARLASDISRLAGTQLAKGRLLEKIGRYERAIACAAEARKLFEATGDRAGLALCCHTMAVWEFHHGDGPGGVRDFVAAARLREEAGDLLGAAQSWHNLGYVQCRTGAPGAAFTSYTTAERLLGLAGDAPDPALRQKAVRERGFVLSHLAYAHAKHGDPADAMARALAYEELVEATQVHREPLLAYMAPALALARDSAAGRTRPARRLAARTGLPADPEVWFRFAARQWDRMVARPTAAAAPVSARRPYLGAYLLLLTERATWCAGLGRAGDRDRLVRGATALARARGWAGEASRITAAHPDVRI